MSKAVLQGNASGTGVVTLQSPNTNTDRTITLPDTSSTLSVTGPSFRVYQGSDQAMANSDTLYIAQLTTETFDTDSCFNNTGSTVNGIPAYSFLPNVPGYYQVNGKAYMTKAAGSPYAFIAIVKNGAGVAYGNYLFSVSAIDLSVMVADLIYLNGTTDYIQLGCQAGTTSVTIKSGGINTYFSAFLAKGA